MEFQKTLEARRSIRRYDSNGTLGEEAVRELINAAILAPSWKNLQTARYRCVMSEDMLRRVREECLPPFNAGNSEGASALIVTSFIRGRSGFDRASGAPENEVGDGWGYYDLGLHNENLVLKAADMGLGTLIMGIRDAAKLRELLGIPDEETIVSVIAVGRPAVAPDRPKRKTPEEIARFY